MLASRRSYREIHRRPRRHESAVERRSTARRPEPCWSRGWRCPSPDLSSLNEDGHGVTGEQAARRGMSDADAHGEETGEVVEGASHDSATLASAFEAAVREDRRDTDLAFEVMQERATEGGLNATGVGAGALPELVGARGEIERMLDYRLQHGSAATRRRVETV